MFEPDCHFRRVRYRADKEHGFDVLVRISFFGISKSFVHGIVPISRVLSAVPATRTRREPYWPRSSNRDSSGSSSSSSKAERGGLHIQTI